MIRARTVLTLVLLLAGCTPQPTTGQVFLSGPLHQAVFPRNYKELADCVTRAVAGRHPVEESVDEATSTAELLSAVYGRRSGEFPLWLLTIKRTADGQSHADVIAASTYQGNMLPADVWPMVETCGKTA